MLPMHSFFFYILFLAALGLNCCTWTFSSCAKQGLLSSCGMQASHWGDFLFFIYFLIGGKLVYNVVLVSAIQQYESAISVCVCVCVCVHAKSLQSGPSLCNPMDCSHQTPLSMGFSSQEYWSTLPCPPPRDLPDPGINPHLPWLLHCRQILYRWATQGSPPSLLSIAPLLHPILLGHHRAPSWAPCVL